MNGFLVLFHRTFDDEPIGLFRTRAEAVAFAKSVRATGEHNGPKTGRGELGRPGIVSRVIGVRVVEFKGGRPVAELGEG